MISFDDALNNYYEFKTLYESSYNKYVSSIKPFGPSHMSFSNIHSISISLLLIENHLFWVIEIY